MRLASTTWHPAPAGARRRPWLGTIAVIALLVAACGGTASPPPSFPAGAVVVHARNRTFDTTELQIPAATQFSLAFVNEDGDLHNIAIRTAADGKGDLLFRFDPISSTTVVVTVGQIPKGSYFFLCEIHPSMHGTVFAY
jgi:plastocyanin